MIRCFYHKAETVTSFFFTFLSTKDNIQQTSLLLAGLIECISDILTPLCIIKIDERFVTFIFHKQFTNINVVRWNNFKVLIITLSLESVTCNTCVPPFPEEQRTFRKCVWSVSLVRSPQKGEREQSDKYQHQLTYAKIIVKHKILQM
jgi:hypothetical protein